MNDNERFMIRALVDDNYSLAKKYAKIILTGITTEKDRVFKEDALRILEEKERKFIDIPYNLQQILVAEDCSNFREDRYLLREPEGKLVKSITSALAASSRLSALDVKYIPSLLLSGKSGVGKTQFCRYLAYTLHLPFVYVRFSSLINSLLGSTQNNLSLVFEFIRKTPCVFCFDEIDAIAWTRTSDDVGEMKRIAISLMQEMDRLPNGIVFIGCTNLKPQLDPAILRRFTITYTIDPLSRPDAAKLADKFFTSIGMNNVDAYLLFARNFSLDYDLTADDVIKCCTQYVIEQYMKEGGTV